MSIFICAKISNRLNETSIVDRHQYHMAAKLASYVILVILTKTTTYPYFELNVECFVKGLLHGMGN